VTDVCLVESKEVAARDQVVVHNIEYFSLDPRHQASQENRVSTVVNVGERYEVGATEVEKHPKGVYPDPACNGLIPWPVDISRPDEDVWDAKSLSVVKDKFILLHLCETIRIAAGIRVVFDGARLVQKPTGALSDVRIDCERADVHEPAKC
jgi:hypothetical protein